MINVRIKQLPPRQPGEAPRGATTKVFLRPGREAANGCRPLEPNEVVALDDEEAKLLLAKLPYELELTLDPPTRPLYFRNSDEADMTSASYNPNTAMRAEQAKQAMANMLADAENPDKAEEMAKINAQERILMEREQAIIQKEIELGLRVNPDDALDVDLAEYVPTNNAVSEAELQAEREAAAAEAAEAPAPRRRRTKAA